MDRTLTIKKRAPAKTWTRRSQFITDDDAFVILCQHAISHLPDSVTGRQAILAALILQAPRTSPLLQHLREIQWHLNTHLSLAQEPAALAPATPLTTERK
jgi:hypothetical protein